MQDASLSECVELREGPVQVVSHDLDVLLELFVVECSLGQSHTHEERFVHFWVYAEVVADDEGPGLPSDLERNALPEVIFKLGRQLFVGL